MQAPEEHRLSNGLRVMLQDWDGPVATTYWWNQVGSVDEQPGEYGFAHFLEHMLFKDAAAKETGVPSSGQLATMVESLGGDINAYTSFDQTVYHVTGTETHWEKWVDGLGSMAKPQRFLNADFQREREVILEELRRSLDSPSRQMYQALFEMNYGSHPFGRPVIGFEKGLKAATCAKLEAFYRRMYRPERMGLVLVGPIGKTPTRKRELLKICERRFGAHVLKPGTIATQATERGGVRKPGVQSRTISFDVQSPSLALAWPTVGLKDPAIPALDMAFDALCMGELSRLYQSLFYGASVVTDVGGGVFAPSASGSGMAYLHMDSTQWKHLGDAASLAREEWKRLVTDGPTEEEMERIRINAESEKLYALQSVDGIASRIGHARFVVDDMAFDFEYLDRIRAAKRKDIQNILSQTCDGGSLSALLFLPKKLPREEVQQANEILEKVVGTWEGNRTAPSIAKKRSTVSKPHVSVAMTQLEGDHKFVYAERRGTPTFSVHLSMFGGSRLEPSVNPGLSHLMAMVWPKGTASKEWSDSKAIARAIEGKAANLEGFSGRNSMGLELNGLARDFDHLTRVMEEILFQPTFPETDVEHARRVVQDSLKNIEDHSSSLCSKQFNETLYGDHPYARLVSGTKESVEVLQAQHLRTWHRTQVLTRPWVISVAGGVEAEEVRTVIDRWLARRKTLSTGQQKSGAISLKIQEPALRAPRWVERKMGREQAHVMVGGLGYRVTDSDRMIGRMLSNVLGGQSGRLFLELREKKSLAYTVSPTQTEGLERGSFGTYIGCANNKVNEAVEGIKSVLELLAKKGPSASEMKRAQEYYLGRRAMDLQGDAAVAASLGLDQLYGVPYQTDEALAKQVRAVRAEDVQRACQTMLCQNPQVTSLIL